MSATGVTLTNRYGRDGLNRYGRGAGCGRGVTLSQYPYRDTAVGACWHARTHQRKELDSLARRCTVSYMTRRKRQPTLTELLRRALLEADSFIGVERATGVTRQSLMKFARGEQSIRLESADKLAAHFGIVSERRDKGA